MKPHALFTLSLLLAACGTSTTDPQQANGNVQRPKSSQNTSTLSQGRHDRPYAKVDVAYQHYGLTTRQAHTIQLQSGSVLQVPAQAFVTQEGKEVKGQVQLQYREVQTPVAIMLSGLPMTYDSAGTAGQFVSAGMVEIYATQQGKQLELAKGKELQLKMAGWQAEANYNLYYLEPESQKWVYRQTAPAPQANPAAKPTGWPAMPAKQRRHLPKPAQPGEKLLRLNLQAPELKQYTQVEWRYAGTDQRFDPNNNPDIQLQQWDDIKLEKLEPYKYRLTMRNNQKTYIADLEPVLSAADIKAAEADLEAGLKEINRKRQGVERQIRKLEQANSTPRVFRNVAIAQLGAYNFDKLYKQDAEVLMTEARLLLPKDSHPDEYRFYYLNSYLNTVIAFTPGQKLPLLDKQLPYLCLVGIAPDGHMLYMNPEQMLDLDISVVKKSGYALFRLNEAPAHLSSRPEQLLAAMPGALREQLSWL